MSTIEQIINEAKASNVTLYIKDGQLAFIAEKGSFPSELKDKVRKHKNGIISALLSMREASSRSDLAPFSLLTEKERQELKEREASGKKFDDVYPMSALQVGMVFHTQLEQFSGIYHDIMAQHVKCPWNRVCLEQALADCIHEHPVLRTGFQLEGDRPLQHVYPSIELPLEVQDIRDKSPEEQERHLADWMQIRKRHVFDWEKGPLFHIHIILRSDESFDFVISFHHAVLDGWSRAALTTTLYNRYEQLLSGQGLPPAKVNWTYREFIAEEQQALKKTGAKAFFAEMLEDAPMEQLPRSKSPESEPIHGWGIVEPFRVLATPLIALAKRLGVPVQSVLAAGHLKVLATVSGQNRAVTCLVYHGRPEAEGAEQSLGLFLNSLPVCMDLERKTWRELIEQATVLIGRSMEYRSYPLSKVQQELDWSFSEVLFNYTHFHVYNDLTKSTERTLASLGNAKFDKNNFDLVIDATREVNDAMWLSLAYNARVLEEDTIARLGRYYVRAFEQMLSGLDCGHHEQTLLSTDEVEQLLVGWNAAQVEYRRDKCLHELFEEQVERCPQATALVYEDQSLTYDELNHQANQLAHYLREQGVKADTLVGLCVERSLEMVVGILGILKAGGAYVPLEPGYPQERLEYMIGDSAPAVVVTQKSLQERLQSTGIKLVCVDGDEVEWRSHSTENLRREETGIRPEHVAYVIYTSGSTGRPKGVMVEHRQVQRLLAVTEEDFRFGAEDVWTLFHSYAFDFSVWELWGALAYGGRLVVVPHWVARSPEEFYELLKREKVTVLNQTPTAFTQLARVDGERAERGEGLSLRAVVFGGEALKLSELKGWVERHGDDKPVLVNMYGITETTVHVTYRRIRKEDVEGQSGSVIGRPLKDLRMYLLDGNQGLVPVGTVGEMYVGGGGVARGYLKRAELTAARFIDDPYVKGERLYRTGDLGRYLENGDLEYMGRIDAQVKVRGYRIELGEIEQQLSGLEGVLGSVVMVREDAGGGEKKLVAYVVAEGYPAEGTVSAEEEAAIKAGLIGDYRKKLGEQLPEYMVPSLFVMLRELPLTGNGKVDRKALPAPEGGDETAVYVGPRNGTEQALCEVWQEVLKQERVGVHDNFFSLGGDSILSIRVVAMLKARGIVLGVKDIFQYQTIEELAVRAATGEAGGAADEEKLEPFALLTEKERAELGEGYADAYPMSTLQVGMVFHTQLEQFSGIYHDIMADHVKCRWDQGCFERALADCIHEYPVLRTGFRLEGDRPLQLVHATMDVPLAVENLRAQSPEEQERYVTEWTEARKRHVFDWENGPLFHIHIFLRTEESFEFVISFHHAVLDGWSRAALTTTLYNRYEQLLSGKTLEPAKVDWTYRDFIAEEQRALESVDAKAHFAAMLEEAPSEQLPRLMPSSGDQRQGRVVVEGFPDLSERLLGLSRELGVPVQSVLLAGHFKVLSAMSGQRHAVSCVTHNGRPETEGAEKSLGLFLNSLPVCVEIKDGESWRGLIERVAEVGARSMEYRGYPLARIQQEVGMELNEVTFNYTHFHVYREMTTETEEKLEVIGTKVYEQINFDFHVDVGRGLNDGLRMVLIYDGGKFDSEQVERIGEYYERAYRQMVQGLQKAHDGELLLSKEEIEQQLVEWNATGSLEALEASCVHELFAEQVNKTPGAVAVVCGGQQLTYEELNEKAEQLAGYLVEAGVGLESRVGIYVRRSAEMLIGVLGVMKAGGAYVPLEMGLPGERVKYMVEDAGVEWVLVDGEGMERLPLAGVDVVLLEGAAEDKEWLADVERVDDGERAVKVKGENLAYILYTSGSTGRPKGVMVEHRNLTSYVVEARRKYLGEEIAGSVVSTPLSFDATLTTLLAPLVAGKEVELLAEGEGMLEELAERIFSREGEGGRLFKVTPAHMEALEYVERKGGARNFGTGKHHVVIGGEQLSAERMKRWKQELLPQAVLVNEYGPTETVVGCSVWELKDEEGLKELEGQVAAPIGRPLGNSQVYVLGESRQLQPVNSIGELYIGGAGVARGYLNQTELTRDRFIANPFVANGHREENGSKLYRTGDLVRWLSNGELMFVGRRDEQVKVRGYRIELGEIEQQLMGLEGVRAALVMAREGAGGEKRLVAYVAPDSYPAEGTVNAEEEAAIKAGLIGEYRKALTEQLPEYMIPSLFVVLRQLPLTANGKVDRKALPAPEGGDETAVYLGPRNGTEQALCEVWQEVLKQERVGVHDNFFTLGGDSILSIRVVAMLKVRGIVLGVKDIFQYQTIEQLALHTAKGEAGAVEEAKLEPFALLTEKELADLGEGYEDAYPMSTLQAGMVFHTQLEQFNGIYHDIVNEHVRCPWNQGCFEQALADCIHEHPVLRTGFRLEGDRPLQLVHASVELPLEVEDLRGRSAEEQEQHVTDWTEARKRHVFDWEQGPLFHIHIFLRTQESFEFVISFHHAVLDGWSRAALTTTLYNRYEELLSGKNLEPAKVDWTYRDFIAEEQRALENTEARAHFATMLEDAPTERLPRLKPWGGERRQGRVVVEGFMELSDQLLGLSRELGVPVQSVLLAGHFKVLSALSGQRRAVSCVTHNGRPEAEGAEKSLGLFLNSVPMAMEVTPGTWRELIERVNDLGVRSMEYRGYPVARIQQEVGMELNEVTFNYTHFHVYHEMTTESEQKLEVIGSKVYEQINFDFHVDVGRGLNDGLRLVLIYDGEKFDPELVERIGKYYERAYRQMVEGLEKAHDGALLLSQEEIEQQVVEWNATGSLEGLEERCVHELFAEQVKKTPEAVAVVCGGQRLSYQELNEKAERLAGYLVEAGVGLESRVGIYVRRSAEMLIGVLGVMKAGGAYVPLEMGLPGERVKYMVEDAGVEWVLVDGEGMERLPLAGVDVVLLEGAAEDKEWLADVEKVDEGRVKVTGENLAYILYTSGSTGRPKGVMVEHRNLANYVVEARRNYVGEEIVGSVVSTPLSFDATLTTLLAPLVAGKEVELLAEGEGMLEDLAERMFGGAGGGDEKARLFKVTPAHLEALEYVERKGGARTFGTGKHHVVIGGEQLSAERMKRWKQELLPQAVLVNEYGPTETVVGCSVWELKDEEGLKGLEGQTSAPIGRPLGNTQVYVLGESGQLQPVNSIGELHIGGAGVARGYLNQEELTRDRFIEDPYVKGGRLYRTGDLVRWLSNGELMFIGRRDEQVKVRGYRIELGEIEQQLTGLEGVRAAVAMVREDAGGEKRLVAYAVPEGFPAEGTVSAEEEAAIKAGLIVEYRKALGEQLPEYMVPSLFVLLRELPLTANGKIDRKALPAPEGSDETAVYVGPRNITEQALCEVWQEVLNRRPVGIHDNFFSLGGDSILSIRVVAMLKARGIVLGVKDIFQYQTIEQLASHALKGDAGAAEEPKLEPCALLTEKERMELGEGYEDAYPMSTLQAGMVFHTQLEQFNGIYHDIINEYVKCPWDQGCFDQALADCIHEYPVLRTGFRLEGDRPLQLVYSKIELPLQVEDLRGQLPEEQERHIAAWTEARKHHVFDWEKGPLFHIHIFLRTSQSFEFVISFHHAVLDGWSRAALTTTLYNRYEQLLSGKTLEPSHVDWTYRDFIAEEQRALESVEARAHFAAMLEEAPAEQLPHLKSWVGERRQGRVVVEGVSSLADRLLGLSRELGVPVQSVLLAGHFKVLSAMSGRRHAVSCVTHNGRPETDGAEKSLGLFLNSLPECVEIKDGESWRGLIERVAEVGARSMEYRGYPLARIQQEVGMELSEVTFNYTHFHVYREMTTESEQKLEVIGTKVYEQINFDFHVDVGRGLNDGLQMVLIYDGGKFDLEQVERIAKYYERAYRQIVEGLEKAHDGELLLSKEEIEQQLVEWNATASLEGLEERCVHELFLEQVKKTPDSVAVVCGIQQLSYKELNEKAERLAGYLVEAGVGLESRVGIYVRRSAEMLIGVLGVLKAGGAYVPLEMGLPGERVKYLVEDSGVEWVLVDGEGMERLPLAGVDVVLLEGAAQDKEWLADVTRIGEAREDKVKGENLAYILYTSGSTGRPKGVMVEHRNLTNYVMEARRRYVGEEIVGSVVSTPLSFDATLTTLLAPLVAGKEVELLAEGDGMLEELAERMFSDEGEGGRLFKVTPAHLEALEYVERKGGARNFGTGKHHVVIGGEQLSAERMKRWKQDLLPQAVLVNEYGPTETVVGCSVWELKDEEGLKELDGQTAAPIGRPLGNTRVYVLGESGHLQPVNSIGELHIGGAGVARGYLNQEELTRDRFIEDPYVKGGRLYRTGDLVRWLSSGELMFVGRGDEQVKVRGYRIELGEIEQQLMGLEGVRAAVVMVREDAGGEKRLVAYVVPDSYPAEGTVSAEEEAAIKTSLIGGYRKTLGEQLPEYMVPSLFVVLRELPLTANGKINRKALPAPEGGDETAVYVGPRNATEQALCEVWQEVLKQEHVGVHDNFFTLGGDSILSIRVVAMLKARGILLGVKDIFQYQTIEQLAAQSLRGSAPAEPSLEAFALLTEKEREELAGRYEDAYPMSTLQAGMVFHTQLEQFNGIYHDIVNEHVKCPWNQECFKQALADCIHEHPVLRTGFRLEGDRPLQLVHTAMELPLEVEDIRGQSVEVQEKYVTEWTEARKHHVFDWEKGPLFHIHIFLRTDESFEFVISFHHAVLDGWSRAALTTTLYNRYERLLRGQELELAKVDWTYRDFIAEEQRALESAEAKAHFAAMLEDAPVEQLPRLKSWGEERRQGRLVVDGFTELSDRLLSLSRELGVPVQSVLLAGHFKVLSALSGQSRAVSCVTHNGRPEAEGAEKSLGLFLNSLPLGLELAECSWRTLIHRVAEMNAVSMEYRGYPLSKIQQDLDWSFSEVLFNYTHFHVFNEVTRSTGQSLEVLESTGFEQTNFDLLVNVSRGLNDAMWLSLVYNAQVLDDELIVRLGQFYAQAFEQMLAGLDQPHHEQTLLSEEEKQLLMAAWNATAVSYPRDKCLHELIEAQVERSPQAMAVSYEDQSLTYEELNRYANRLARYLREHGVKAGTLVGLCVERSLEMVVGILGILKAGGAYVPLEPGYPQERLEYMIADSAPAMLVTQASLQERLRSAGITMACLDANDANNDALNTYAANNLERAETALTPDHLAYVIYTSGSTGTPKGAMNAHSGVVNRLLWARDEYELRSDDRILQKTPFSFDVSVWELLLPLLSGAELVMARPGGHMDPRYLAATIEARKITTVHFVPSMLQVFLEHAEASKCRGLRRVLCSGEALPYALQQRFMSVLPDVELHNLYGPTEAAIDVTSWLCQAEQHEGIVPIGKPIANIQMHVLDRYQQLAPQGVLGELYIGGIGVARGYWNRPEMTAERFIPDPFSTEAGARMYKTGDVGRWLTDGAIEYVGRNDHQVKLRGFRIELGEIEQRLMQQAGVQAAVVMVREDEVGEKRLVGYVVPSGYSAGHAEESERAAITAEFIKGYRDGLSKLLPEYMVPAHFVLLEELPLTPNGKLDRKALPAPATDSGTREYVAPKTATEAALRAVWMSVLGVKSLGITDSFFDLGGHSISAIHLISQANKQFDDVLELRDIFQMPTVREMASYIDTHRHLKARKTNARPANLLELKVGTPAASPLFLIHPVGGYATCYSELAMNLDFPGSVFGVQVAADVPETIEGMAQQYIEAIRQVQPEGPYLLGGWSMGGVVAYEMAQQLHASEAKVDLLLMLDTFCPIIGVPPDDERTPLEEAALDLGADRDALSKLTMEELFEIVLRLGHEQKQLPASFGMPELRERYKARLAMMNALSSYRPSPLTGEIQLIRATANQSEDWSLGWGSIVTKVSVTEQSGDHTTMLTKQPHLGELAQTISGLIQDCSREDSVSPVYEQLQAAAG